MAFRGAQVEAVQDIAAGRFTAKQYPYRNLFLAPGEALGDGPLQGIADLAPDLGSGEAHGAPARGQFEDGLGLAPGQVVVDVGDPGDSLQ